MIINLIDRYIIECINKDSLNLIEISNRTQIDLEIIKRILERLLNLDLVLVKEGYYSLNINLLKKLHDNKDIEVRRLLSELSVCNDQLKIRKVYLRSNDLNQVKNMFLEIDSFIKRSSREATQISNQEVFFWGSQNYGKLINNYLN